MASADLARRTTIPQPTVAKLLKVLARGRLTVAHRGRAGGYSLDRPAEDISVAQIIEAVEGPVAVAACVEGTHDNCELERTCPMNGRCDVGEEARIDDVPHDSEQRDDGSAQRLRASGWNPASDGSPRPYETAAP